MIRNPTGRKERICIYGSGGVGKSTCWVDLANKLAITDSPGKVYVGEVDPTWDALIEEAGRGIERIEVSPLYEFSDIQKWVEGLRGQVRPEDWAVVDLMDIVWRRAQADFTDRRYGYDLDEWFMAAAKAGGMDELGGNWGINWTVINRTYDKFVQPYLRLPCNILAITGDDALQSPNKQGKGGDDKDIRDLFGRVGRKPDGQKHIPRQFHTVLYLQQPNVNERIMNAIKDRARPVGPFPFRSFTIDYLIRRAKWEGMADLMRAGVKP